MWVWYLLDQVLSMSRLGGAAAVAPVVADISSEVLLLLLLQYYIYGVLHLITPSLPNN